MQSHPIILIVIGAWLIPQCTFGQIPTACANNESLENLRCCPTTSDGVCGENAGRGECAELSIEGYSRDTTDVRNNWPHYFTQVCQCNGNYSGYDCSRCKFGHYGPNCSQSQVLPRQPIASYTDQDWEDFINILQLLRTRDSGYTIVLEESTPGNSNVPMTNITFYNMYVWVHHSAARDASNSDINSRTDYAHTGPAFHTWHRYLNLWLEWEIQYLLRDEGSTDYHTFRLPYWDWRIEIQNSTGIRVEDLFTENRFGATRNISGFPQVVGDIVGPSGWDSVCVQVFFEVCNPTVSTGPLQRCPFTGTNPCHSSNPDWPTMQLVIDALAIDTYDSLPYNLDSRTGYRPFIDFDIHEDLEECANDRMCQCLPNGGPSCNVSAGETALAYDAQLHNDVHFILGIGDVSANTSLDDAGNIFDMGASPNDPVFIVHHTMVDCMFDEWLRRNPDEGYPNVPLTISTRGHQAQSYMIPFFPLYTNAEMFKPASNFGYFCNLPNLTISDGGEGDMDSGVLPKAHLKLFTLLSMMFIIVLH